MPIFYHLDIVPTSEGAQIFLRDGHGRFVDRRELEAPFNAHQKDDQAILDAVEVFLVWERKTRGGYK